MSIRFRQSMKLLPGVRLNFSKETVGLSFGVPIKGLEKILVDNPDYPEVEKKLAELKK